MTFAFGLSPSSPSPSATPTLIKVLPAPLRRFIGDLSKAEKILFGLDLREKA